MNKWEHFTDDEIIELRRGVVASIDEGQEYDEKLALQLYGELDAELKRRNLKRS